MFAAVDLGSNSFRLHIGRHDGDTMRIIKSARDPIRLGAGLDSKGNLTAKAMESAIESLARFNSILSTFPLSAVRVVATNTIRIARNSAVFLPAAEAAIGYPIEIISGEEEGRLIYMGVASTLSQNERRLVLDIGGGSTEVILGKGPKIEQVESFSVGTVPQSLNFFPNGVITAEAFDAAVLSARSRFEDAVPLYKPELWSNAYGSSGTMRAIADAISKNGLGDGQMSLKSLEGLRKRLIQFGHAGNIDLVGMKADRAASITSGLAILVALMQEFSIKVVTPIEAGLRMGVLWDLHLRATKRDRREQSAREFLQRFKVDEKRAEKAAQIASAFLGLLKPSDDTYTKLLFWSGLLHEVGLVVSHSGYHKHAAYMVENADLPGFTTREQRVMSNLVLAQKGNLRKVADQLSDSDFAKAVVALRLALMFMHARIDVAPDDIRLRMKKGIELEIRKQWVTQHPTVAYWIDKEKECWSEVGIDFYVKLTN
ncbi:MULTISPECIES: Ppx/GppA phosphatase family protein [Oxalobacteraceae]|uniref:Ppx/GppA family phosphatase n=1 Tax=Herminiimonas contaminans TaxID=1111140 RepID=A0ABS0EPJ5_9BURK|nr:MULTISPECIES: Ppx/GppA phosphatase family protein [Oxalobacteraceae]MBF8176711.1 Ppx/GppA family phosphatase [Herminiimonas contaminans]